MNILFTAFSINEGIGGHIRSLYQIKEEVNIHHKCFVAIFGQTEPPFIENNKYVFFINVKKINYFQIRSFLNDVIKRNKIDLIHSFDEFSYIISQVSYNLPRILTRCGGPNPLRYPFAKYLTCFSYENYEFFKSQDKFKASELLLIPNRVKEFKCDVRLVDELSLIINRKSNDFILLRITRISKDYIQSINQSINLLHEIKNRTDIITPKLIILGSIYDDVIYQELVKDISVSDNIYFISDLKYTKDAKKILDIADVVIGTGRGLMEAASKSKILFAPLKGANFPVLLNDDNFSVFFYHNFSERTKINNCKNETIDTSLNFEEILQQKNELSNFSKNMFNEYFKIENGIEKYLKLYERVVIGKHKKNKLHIIVYYLLYCKYLMYKKRK